MSSLLTKTAPGGAQVRQSDWLSRALVQRYP